MAPAWRRGAWRGADTNYANEARANLQVGSTPLVTRPLFLAVRRALPDAESIVTRFNAQLRSMIADRAYHRLLHVDWISADVDGDGLVENVPQSDQAGPTAPQHVYTRFTREKLLAKPGGAVTAVLRRRVFLQLLDGRPGQLQDLGSRAEGSQELDLERLHVHLEVGLSCGVRSLPRRSASAKAGLYEDTVRPPEAALKATQPRFSRE